MVIAGQAKPAQAQAAATADQLFQQGLVELKEGHLDRACPLFADSYRLDPLPGALFTLAECEARSGKLATAAVRFKAFLELAATLPEQERRRQAERIRAAEQRRIELEPRLPHLTVSLAQGAADGAEVRDGDVTMPRSALGVALAVDPGVHVLTLRLPDGGTTQREVTLREGEATSVMLELPSPAPEAKPPETAPQAPPAAAPAPVAAAPLTTPPQATRGSGRRTLTYAAFGIGTAGIVVGSVAGAILISRKGTVDEHCPDARCDDEGYDAASDIPTLDTVANVGFGVGALGLAVGLIMVLTDRDSARSSASALPALVATPRGALLRGRF